MEASFFPLFLCLLVVALMLLWVFLLKRQARIRRERKMERKVSDQLDYEQRLEAERKRRGEA